VRDSRLAAMLHCYLDESATEGDTPVAVVAGVVLEMDRFAWLDIAWQRAIIKHQAEPYIHMKDFAQHGRFKGWSARARTALFTDLAEIIMEHKRYSIAARLMPSEYNRHFSAFPPDRKLSIYSMCFLMLAMVQGRYAENSKYKDKIPFLMDDGNKYWAEVKHAHNFLANAFQEIYPVHVGSLSFGDDKEVRALQAADVIAWTVRRKISGGAFTNGFEPLLDVLGETHLEHPVEEAWMAEIAGEIRGTLTP